jgi:hypothetical protein
MMCRILAYHHFPLELSVKKFKIDWTIASALACIVVVLVLLGFSLHRLHTVQYRAGLESGCVQSGMTFLECRKLVRIYDDGNLPAYQAELDWKVKQLEDELAYLQTEAGKKNPYGWVRPEDPDFVKMTRPWWKFWE